MLTCEECGCLVDPEATDVHETFHKNLVTKSELTPSTLTPPNRTKWLNEIIVQDC